MATKLSATFFRESCCDLNRARVVPVTNVLYFVLYFLCTVSKQKEKQHFCLLYSPSYKDSCVSSSCMLLFLTMVNVIVFWNPLSPDGL